MGSGGRSVTAASVTLNSRASLDAGRHTRTSVEARPETVVARGEVVPVQIAALTSPNRRPAGPALPTGPGSGTPCRSATARADPPDGRLQLSVTTSGERPGGGLVEARGAPLDDADHGAAPDPVVEAGEGDVAARDRPGLCGAHRKGGAADRDERADEQQGRPDERVHETHSGAVRAAAVTVGDEPAPQGQVRPWPDVTKTGRDGDQAGTSVGDGRARAGCMVGQTGGRPTVCRSARPCESRTMGAAAVLRRGRGETPRRSAGPRRPVRSLP